LYYARTATTSPIVMTANPEPCRPPLPPSTLSVLAPIQLFAYVTALEGSHA